MQTIRLTTARRHLAQTMDRVIEEHVPLLITRQKGESVVIMSLAQFNSLAETAYLLGSPNNVARLTQSISNLRPRSTSIPLPCLSSPPPAQ